MTAVRSLVIKDGNQQLIRDTDSLLVGTGVDASAAGTLTVGGTTATAITVGSAGITTSFPGPVTLQGDVTTVGGTTFTTDATFEGNVTFGNGPADTVAFASTTTVVSDINFGGSAAYQITNLKDPTNAQDAATKASSESYADTKVASVGASSPLSSSGGTTPSISFPSWPADASGALTNNGSGTLSWVAPVTDVTASAPLASSGGATPDISLTGIVPVANGGTGTSTAFTAGSVVFAGPSGVYAQDNASLFFDNTNNRLGIGTASPSTTIHVSSGAVNGTAIATLANTAGDFQVFRVDANPEGSVTGSIGDIADDSTNGVVYVKTSGSASNTGWSPLASLGTKVFLVVEGGQYATIQAAIDATPTGTNTTPAYSVILVGPKANVAGAQGSWGSATLAANKSLMIAGLGGAQTSKDIRIDSLTFDSSAAGLNANFNENYISGLYITSSSASSIVTYSGTGAIRLKLNNCYVVNSGAGDAVTNTNSNVNGSLYLNNCIVSAQSSTGIALKNSGNTYVQNRTEITTTGAGASSDTGRAISTSGGNVFLYDSTVEATAPRAAIELTGGSAYLEATYSRIQNFNNTATATAVTAAAGTNFGAGFVSLILGSSVAALGSNVAGAGTFTYSDVSFGFVPTLTITNQSAAFATAPWFTTAMKQGVSLTAPGSGLFQLNASGRLTRYNDAAPTNGQVLIGDTTAGYFKAATISAGSGVSITNGAGTITIAATGSGGTVTSVDVSGGTTGLTTSGGPITGSGTITLAGTLGVANGGTGATTLTGYVKGSGTSALTASSTIPGSDVSGNISGNAANVTGTVAIANGGTGQTTAAAAFGALSPLTTKGDVLGFDTANARIPVGTNGQVLTADSTQALGLKWATPVTGLTVGSTAIASGAVNQVLFQGASNVLQESANFTFDGSQAVVGGVVTIGQGLHQIEVVDLASSVTALQFDSAVNELLLQSTVDASTGALYPGQLNLVDGNYGAQLNGYTGLVDLEFTVDSAGSATPTIIAKDETATRVSLLLDASQIDVNSKKIVNVANGVAPNDAVNVSQLSAIVSGVSSVTASAPLASSGGATPDISLTGVVDVANGGTGTSSWTAGSIVFAGAGGTALAQDNANLFWADSTNRFGVGISGAALTHTFNVGDGTTSNFCVAAGGRIHTYDGSSPTNGQILIGDTAAGNFAKATIGAGTNIAVTNGAGTVSIGLTGQVAVTNGGTGSSSLTANAVILGNGTSAVQTVAPSTSGNVLTSNGTTWQSVAPTDFSTVALNTATNSVPQGDACYVSAAGTVNKAIANGTSVATARVAGIASATSNRVSVLGIVPSCNFESSLSLAVGDSVFLSATSAGKLTNVSPSAGPSIVAEVGIITTVNAVGGGAAAADVLWQPKSIIIL